MSISREYILMKKDVPFSDGYGKNKNLLVVICDTCGNMTSIPHQSGQQVQHLSERGDIPLELVNPLNSSIKAVELIKEMKQVEVARITGVKQPQICAIKKGFRSRDTQATL